MSKDDINIRYASYLYKIHIIRTGCIINAIYNNIIYDKHNNITVTWKGVYLYRSKRRLWSAFVGGGVNNKNKIIYCKSYDAMIRNILYYNYLHACAYDIVKML